MAQAGTGVRRTTCGRYIPKAPSAGQAATHSRHPVHSADLMVTSLSTGRFAGHARAHFAQSMQAEGARRMRIGLNMEASPSKAPYGQRYRHQKFSTSAEAITRIPITMKRVRSR